MLLFDAIVVRLTSEISINLIVSSFKTLMSELFSDVLQKEPVGDGCYSSTLTGFAYKDCVSTCEGENCNNNNEEIFDKAAEKDESGNYRQISCYSCSSDYDEKEGRKLV